MHSFATTWDAWKTAGALGMAMIATWAVGWSVGRRVARLQPGKADSKFNDAIIALLGLLLAFTFSMSLARHEHRRQMVVTDSNSIGDFATCAGLLDDPVRSRLLDEIRTYVRQRLALASGQIDDDALDRSLGDIRAAHSRMQSLVKEAVDGGTPIAVPLVNTLNEVTSSHAARMSAVHDRIPGSILILLFLTAVVSMALLGTQHGIAREWHPGALFGYTLLVSLVIWVTLDLNQPRRGWITVTQEPLLELQKALEK